LQEADHIGNSTGTRGGASTGSKLKAPSSSKAQSLTGFIPRISSGKQEEFLMKGGFKMPITAVAAAASPTAAGGGGLSTGHAALGSTHSQQRAGDRHTTATNGTGTATANENITVQFSVGMNGGENTSDSSDIISRTAGYYPQVPPPDPEKSAVADLLDAARLNQFVKEQAHRLSSE
jgi:hypothetical protein